MGNSWAVGSETDRWEGSIGYQVLYSFGSGNSSGDKMIVKHL